MYLYTTITDKNLILQQPIFKNNSKNKKKEVENISEVQVWVNSFDNTENDFAELRVIGKDGKLLRTEKVQGY